MNTKLLKTTFIATVGVKECRETIPIWVNRNDVVLEIGCEWGTTTTLIAPYCQEVIGTDISPKCIARAQERHPNLHFEVLDGFDICAALNLQRHFTKVYIDMSGISGYRSLLDAISLLNMYAMVLQPEAIIIKSKSLKQFAMQCRAWHSSEWELTKLSFQPTIRAILYLSIKRRRNNDDCRQAVFSGATNGYHTACFWRTSCLG